MPQEVTPYLLCEDVAAALDWLSRAFGPEETSRFDGRRLHQPRRHPDAYDPEGQLWSFAQHVRDVAPGTWGATTPA